MFSFYFERSEKQALLILLLSINKKTPFGEPLNVQNPTSPLGSFRQKEKMHHMLQGNGWNLHCFLS